MAKIFLTTGGLLVFECGPNRLCKTRHRLVTQVQTGRCVAKQTHMCNETVTVLGGHAIFHKVILKGADHCLLELMTGVHPF